jgi:hypothetical protein
MLLVFGCTATLDDETFGQICNLAAFKADTKIIQTSIGRPDIVLIRGVAKRSAKSSFPSLHFVVVAMRLDCPVLGDFSS